MEGVKALADENTVAIVIINPGNPCGSVFTHDHLRKVGKASTILSDLSLTLFNYNGSYFLKLFFILKNMENIKKLFSSYFLCSKYTKTYTKLT